MNYDFEKAKQEFINKNGYEPSQEELINYMRDTIASTTPSVKEVKKSNASGALLIIWFLASIFALLYLSGVKREVELAIVFVQYFVVFGLMIFLASKKVENLSLLFILALCFLGYIVFCPGGIKLNIDSDLAMFAGLGLVFFAVGIIMFGITIKTFIDSKKYIVVNAVVCDHLRGSKRTVACVYEYEYNGQKFRNSDNFYTNVGVLELGTPKNIKINPENPTQILVGNAPGLFFLVFALPFIFMGGLFVLVGFGIIG